MFNAFQRIADLFEDVEKSTHLRSDQQRAAFSLSSDGGGFGIKFYSAEIVFFSLHIFVGLTYIVNRKSPRTPVENGMFL